MRQRTSPESRVQLCTSRSSCLLLTVGRAWCCTVCLPASLSVWPAIVLAPIVCRLTAAPGGLVARLEYDETSVLLERDMALLFMKFESQQKLDCSSSPISAAAAAYNSFLNMCFQPCHGARRSGGTARHGAAQHHQRCGSSTDQPGHWQHRSMSMREHADQCKSGGARASGEVPACVVGRLGLALRDGELRVLLSALLALVPVCGSHSNRLAAGKSSTKQCDCS